MLVCVTLFQIISFKNYAQSYTFTTLDSLYQNLTSGTALNTVDSSGGWDDAKGVISIPFNFHFFGNIVSTFYFDDTFLTDDTIAEDRIINVFGANIWGDSIPVNYQIDGTTPNRVYKVEWAEVCFDVYDNYDSANIEFQLWFYETTNVIEIHFGNSHIPNPNSAYDGMSGPQILLADFAATPIKVILLTDSASNPTTTSNLSAVLIGTPDLNTVYRFTPTVIPSAIAINAENQITIYPNPAKTDIKINLPKLNNDEIISVYDIQGQLLVQQPMQQAQANLNISNLANGIYFIKVTGSGIDVVKKIIKE